MFQNPNPLLKDLKNFLLLKSVDIYYRLTYPRKILPNRKFVKQIDIQKAIDSDKIYVLRRSNQSESETFNDLGLLREEAISDKNTWKEIPSLSFNLLGGFFKTKHSKYSTNGKGSEEWDGASMISFWDFINLFEIKKFKGFYIFDAKDLHNITVPISSSETNREAKKKLAQLKLIPINEDGKIMVNGKTIIRHVPTNLNYWHIQLEIISPLHENKSIPRGTGNEFAKSACSFVLTNILTTNAKKIAQFSVLKKELYYSLI